MIQNLPIRVNRSMKSRGLLILLASAMVAVPATADAVNFEYADLFVIDQTELQCDDMWLLANDRSFETVSAERIKLVFHYALGTNEPFTLQFAAVDPRNQQFLSSFIEVDQVSSCQVWSFDLRFRGEYDVFVLINGERQYEYTVISAEGREP